MRGAQSGLSSPGSKIGKAQRVVLDLIGEHEAAGEIPTNGRFVFYELEQRGNATKPDPDDRRPNRRRSIGWPPGQQDVIDALTDLRNLGMVPWSYIVDEERHLFVWQHAASIVDGARDGLDALRINPWGDDPPPLILCESKATAGVLAYAVAAEYVCPIAGTKGQSRGFLETEIAPLVAGKDRPVSYLGDLDKSGADIEANSRRVLERAAGRVLDWRRIGMTQDQADARGIEPIWKKDGRTGLWHWAIEVESMGQRALVDLVQAHLDDLVPEPLAHVLEREHQQRERVRALLEGETP